MSVQEIPLSKSGFCLLLSESKEEIQARIRPLLKHPEEFDARCHTKDPGPCLAILGPGTLKRWDMGLITRTGTEDNWVADVPKLLQDHPSLEGLMSRTLSPVVWACLRQGLSERKISNLRPDETTLELIARAIESHLIGLHIFPETFRADLRDYNHRRGLVLQYQNRQQALTHFHRLIDRGAETTRQQWQRFLLALGNLVTEVPMEGTQRQWADAIERALDLPSFRYWAISHIRQLIQFAPPFRDMSPFPRYSRAINVAPAVNQPLGHRRITLDEAVWSGHFYAWISQNPNNIPQSLDEALINAFNQGDIHGPQMSTWLRLRNRDQVEPLIDSLSGRVLEMALSTQGIPWVNDLVISPASALNYVKAIQFRYLREIAPPFLRAIQEPNTFAACAPYLLSRNAELALPEMLRMGHPKDHLLQIVRQNPDVWQALSASPYGQPAFELAIERNPSLYWDGVRSGMRPLDRFDRISFGLPVNPPAGQCPDAPMKIKHRVANATTGPTPSSPQEEEFSL